MNRATLLAYRVSRALDLYAEEFRRQGRVERKVQLLAEGWSERTASAAVYHPDSGEADLISDYHSRQDPRTYGLEHFSNHISGRKRRRDKPTGAVPLFLRRVLPTNP